MIDLIVSVFRRIFESYMTVVSLIPKDWFILFRILLFPLSLLFYAFTVLVILTVLLIVVFIAIPISYISKLFLRDW